MTTTISGVADTDTGALDEAGAADAFLATFKDAETPSDTGDEETEAELKKKKAPAKTAEKKTADAEDEADDSEETPEDEAEDEESGDEEDDNKAKAKKYVDDDETYVKVKVGEEDHEVPVSQLKRLFGQEASLTRKSQEVATERTKVEAEAQRYATGLETLLKRANDAAEPYRKIDLLVASKTLSAEELTYLRGEMDTKFGEVKFLKDELDGVLKGLQDKSSAERVTQAQATVKALADPENPSYIEGWSEKTYNDIRAFAVTAGMDQGVVNNLVDAPAFKLIHMAMLYKRGVAKVTTTKVNKTAKKIVKTSSSPAANRSAPGKASADKALKALQQSGSTEDAANAFFARMTPDSDD